MNNYFSQNQQNRLNALEQLQQIPYGNYRSNMNVIYSLVSGFEEAKAYPVSPGKVGLLFDNQENEFYLKTVDSIGMQTIKKFTYSEIPLPSSSTPAIADSGLNKRLETIENSLNILLQEHQKGEVKNEKPDKQQFTKDEH